MACSDAGIAPPLQARRVSVTVDGKRLLDEVSLAPDLGQVTCILGPNGAGKSTLLKALAGALRPSAGEVMFAGRPIRTWSSGELARRRAVLSQTTALSFPFRVIEVVRLGRSPHAGRVPRRADERIVETALEAVDATSLADRRYPTLSGGEQQRVQLARVLAQVLDDKGRFDGRWLMLDEPTSSLDLIHQHHVLALARQVAASGGGVIAILHDLNLAAAVANQLCLLQGGRVAAVGRVDETLKPGLVEAVFGIRARIIDHPDAPIPLVVPIRPATAARPVSECERNGSASD
jgi:iron complex transport system ATP-binding protein